MSRHRHLLPEYALVYARTVAGRIVEHRTARKMAQFRLAVIAGIHQTTLDRIENVETIPNIAELKIIADALHISVANLVDDTALESESSVTDP